MQIGLAEAAKLTGKDPTTITQAVDSGKLLASQDAAGSRVFNITELERVYGPLVPGEQAAHSGVVVETGATSMNAILERIEELHEKDVSFLRERIRMLEHQLENLRDDRDKWQAQAGQITPLITDQSYSAEKQRREQHQAAEAAATKAPLAGASARQSPSIINKFKAVLKQPFFKKKS